MRLYDRYRFAILETPVLTEAECQLVIDRIKDLRVNRPDCEIKRNTFGSQGEYANYGLYDGFVSCEIVPELINQYRELARVTSAISGRDLVPSPHQISGVNVRVYEEGGCEGLHYDTNPMSMLVFVSNGSPLQIEINGTYVDVDPIPGHLAVFEGHKMLHRVPDGAPGDFRVSVPMNVYERGDTFRPHWIDKGLYENTDYSGA